jgi:hypothetical protein
MRCSLRAEPPNDNAAIRSVHQHFERAEAAHMIKRAGDILAAIERALTVIAVVFLFVIMMLVVADVFMRYVVNRPFCFN